MSEPTQELSSYPHDESPVTAAGDEQLLAALADDFAARLRRHEHPRVEEYAAKHPELADRIRKVLQAIALIEESRTADPATAGERLGSTIGRYKLLERIGEGGFGVVYMAEQVTPVRRKLALKVLKPGMDSRQVLARFEAERQALAIMDHPNIARVFDAGATETGRPYFVMELVKGVPITEFCDQHQVPPRERLKLFAQVCHAVQHAHQKGIIHRDIKPTNVLVVVHDTEPVVKVIDFGIAKALGQELTEKTLFTGFAQLLGTPLYMSPEQAGQSAIDVDTRSDIYSLGVLLYELLSGTTPFDKERFRQAAQDEIRRIIREEEPPKPSTRLSASKETLASVSAQRHTEPAKLTKLVRGELDWIVMKALEKDRNRRYEAANALAQDVERFLNDEIVLARPPSGLYRFRKLVRRNRLVFGASAAVGSALLLGAILSTALAIRLKHTADAVRAEQSRTAAALVETKRQKEAAEEATAEAEVVNVFLTGDIIGAASPEVQRGRKLTVEEAVENAASKVGTRFKDRPLIEASVRDALAKTLRALGRFDQAAAHAKAALDLRRRLLGDDDPRTLHSLSSLGVTLSMQGKLSEAEPLLREALARSRRVLGDDHSNTRDALKFMGGLLESQAKFAEAEPLYRERLQRNRRLLGNDAGETINATGDLGNLLIAQGNLAKAEPLMREASEGSTRLYGNDHPFGSATELMGALLQKQGKFAQAEALYREALGRDRRLLGDDHPNTIHSINNVGVVLEQQGKFAEAEPLFREGLERSRRVLGDDTTTLDVITSMGKLLMTQGKLSEAEPLLREALERRCRVLGDDHPNTINSIHNMGLLLEKQGKLSDAELLYREALERSRRVLRDDDANMRLLKINMGALLRGQGKLAEAEPLLREAVGPVGSLRMLEVGSPQNLEFAIRQAKELKLEGLSALDLLTCGEYFLLAGDDQKAVETIQKAMAGGGSEPFYPKALGWALLRSGRGEQARKALAMATTENSPTTRAATTRSASTEPATRSADDVDRWTAAYLLGAVSQGEFVKRGEPNYPSLVWFYVGEKLDMSGDRSSALAAYRKSAKQSKQHRTTNWSAYRIKQITGSYENTATAPTTVRSLTPSTTSPVGGVGKR